MDKQHSKDLFHSKITRIGKLLFISHELPLDPGSGELITDDFTKAVKVCMENLRSDVESEGTKIDNIISTTFYVNNHDQVKTLDDFFAEFFGTNPPVKKIVEDKALSNVPVHVDAVAIIR